MHSSLKSSKINKLTEECQQYSLKLDKKISETKKFIEIQKKKYQNMQIINGEI